MRSSALASFAAIGALIAGCTSPQPKAGVDRQRDDAAKAKLAETKKDLTARSLLSFTREFPGRPETDALLLELEAARYTGAVKKDSPEIWFLFLAEFPDSPRKPDVLGRYRSSLSRRIVGLKSPYLAHVSDPLLSGGPAGKSPATAGQLKVLAEVSADSEDLRFLLCARRFSGDISRARKNASSRLAAMAAVEELSAGTPKTQESCWKPEAVTVRKDSASELAPLLQKVKRAIQGGETLAKADRRYQESLDRAKASVAGTESLAKEVQADPKASLAAKDAKVRARLALKAYEGRPGDVLAAKQTLESLDGFEKTGALLAVDMMGL